MNNGKIAVFSYEDRFLVHTWDKSSGCMNYMIIDINDLSKINGFLAKNNAGVVLHRDDYVYYGVAGGNVHSFPIITYSESYSVPANVNANRISVGTTENTVQVADIIDIADTCK
jgi:hypothetical protein